MRALGQRLKPLGWLALCGLVALTGCSSTTPPRYRDAPGAVIGPARLAVVDNASRMIGTPYRFGGNTTAGFDCSGLVQYAHAQAGIRVPRTTGRQWASAAPLDREHLLPGDLVFFALSGNGKTSHVGIYEGGGRFIHAPSSGKSVSRASLDNPFWQRHLIGGKSFLSLR